MATTRTRKLPQLLVLDHNLEDRAVFRNYNAKKDDIAHVLGVDSISILPGVRPEARGVTLYADDEGMDKDGYHLNNLVNPFIKERDLLFMARHGGPRGPIVAQAEKSHSRAMLKKLFAAEDKRSGDGSKEYTSMLDAALKRWDESD